MSLLDNLPHKATIQRQSLSAGALGGSKATAVVEQTSVTCWEQYASEAEMKKYQKKGMQLHSKIYFASDPGITERNQILITERNGTTVASPIELEVGSEAMPDASSGKGILFRVLAYVYIGRTD